MNFKRFLWFCLFVFLLGAVMIYFKIQQNGEIHIVETGNKPISNPFKGWVCSADDLNIKQDVNLAFVLVKWSEFEPESGIYDFERLEAENHFNEWEKKSVKMVLRVVCDYPRDDKDNITIPTWLYKKINGDGDWYNNSYGYGFSPNYSSPVFLQEHKKLINTLGKRYNKDSRIAYIQLGSIGHWGEWHVNYGEGIRELPKSTVTDKYVMHYINSFPDKKLLMRRPYSIAKKYDLGLFNDSFAHKESTDTWITWIGNGYTSDQNGEVLPGMNDFWKMAPSGGEIASYESLEYYLDDKFEETYEQLIQSHTTFLGPNSPAYEEELAQENIEKLTADMGYTFTINRYTIFNNSLWKNIKLKIIWSNIGIAPIYENWPVRVSLLNGQNQEVSYDIPDTNITKWIPGEHPMDITFPYTKKLPKGKYKIAVAILDPSTMEPAIKLALRNEISECTYVIGEFEE